MSPVRIRRVETEGGDLITVSDIGGAVQVSLVDGDESRLATAELTTEEADQLVEAVRDVAHPPPGPGAGDSPE